jgi:hypothetical protein
MCRYSAIDLPFDAITYIYCLLEAVVRMEAGKSWRVHEELVQVHIPHGCHTLTVLETPGGVHISQWCRLEGKAILPSSLDGAVRQDRKGDTSIMWLMEPKR